MIQKSQDWRRQRSEDPEDWERNVADALTKAMAQAKKKVR